MNQEQVYGLYDDSWLGLLVEAAFEHPAKAAKGLAYWLIAEGLRRGWWARDTLLLDPFAGVGGFGIAAAAHGVPFLGVELEDKFCNLAQQNIDLHRREWELMGYPVPQIVQGDSRYLSQVVSGHVGGAVTSPPYIDSVNEHGEGPGMAGNARQRQRILEGSPRENAAKSAHVGYGSSPGQIGAMKAGTPPIGGITSPPYERSAQSGSRHGHSGITKRWAKEGKSVSYFRYDDDNASDNIGNLDSETYWGAIEAVLRQLWALFPEGAHLAWVVKPFVRNKKLVDLPSMTLDLMQRLGWEAVTWIDAMLVAEGEQADMFGGTYRKERKSFFRRLAERNGAPRIDAEVVLVVRKPGSVEAGAGTASVGGVTSPPFLGITATAGDPNYAWKFHGDQQYGTTPGQIGRMKEGRLP